MSTRRTLTTCKPAHTATRQRKGLIQKMVDADMDWVVRNWNCQATTQLLEHLLREAQVQGMTVATRDSWVYAYNEKAQFMPGAKGHPDVLKALTAAEELVQKKPPIPITSCMALAIEFFKG
eukprot:1652020-Heterocapsa_arctica.AAC.1